MNVIVFEVKVMMQDCLITCRDVRYGYLNRSCHKSMLSSAMMSISAQVAKQSMRAQFVII